MGVTYAVRCKACNDVGNSTVSAASDPIVASTLADPPYITEIVVRTCKANGVLERLDRRVSFDRLRVHWCFGIGLHERCS